MRVVGGRAKEIRRGGKCERKSPARSGIYDPLNALGSVSLLDFA
jgi:hypothetical protein